MSKVLAGRYELLERIGEGGMSVVYKAKDKLLNRFVAIKILKPEFINDHKFIDSFRRESQAAASMSHPNIVNIYDVGKEGNIHYIVMELIEGRALSDVIKEQGPMAYPKVIAISKQIAAALAFAHKNHIIHRDVKPHNIMMTPNGTAKITDFGIAKAVNAATIVDNTDGIIGSVHYFSPEQARGGYVDEKSDIYSLGIVMFEMLTGNVPFDGDNPVNIALMHINGEMPRPSQMVTGVPPALEHIIMKCTDKYPVNRYASADELIEALNNLEFVGSVVGGSVLMGADQPGDYDYYDDYDDYDGPVAETDYDEGDEYEDFQPEKQKKPVSQKQKKKKRLIIILACVAAALIAGLVVCFALGVFGGKEIQAPDVTGLTVSEAEQVAAQYDLKIKEGRPVVDENVEVGKIVSQSPEAGGIIKTGSAITVYVSAGPGDGSVPDVVGMEEDSARAAIEEAGFKVNVSSQASEEESGTIISQDPKGGEQAEKGSTVNLVASDGSLAMANMPYLIGKSLSDAKSALKKAKLKTGDVNYDFSDTYAEGEVMWQQYDSGSRLDKNTSVRLTVSKGPQPTTTTTTTTQPPTTQAPTEPPEPVDGF
ncbi:MAG: Stk1 family PASTA domain-containing Ser/Thr kinase [Firmicutes bacterium]|nr:Stk1 family PASTA domain-containing Ser/Thr kinase [Bacillota bacterium]